MATLLWGCHGVNRSIKTVISVMYTIDDRNGQAVWSSSPKGWRFPGTCFPVFKFANRKSKLVGTIPGTDFERLLTSGPASGPEGTLRAAGSCHSRPPHLSAP